MFGSHRSNPACMAHNVPPKKLKTAVDNISKRDAPLPGEELMRLDRRVFLDNGVPPPEAPEADNIIALSWPRPPRKFFSRNTLCSARSEAIYYCVWRKGISV
jgi:hypothetical protein